MSNVTVNVTVKNIPEGLYEKLKEQADRHRRSMNQEIIHTLGRQLESGKMSSSEILEKARGLRKKLADEPLTENQLRDAIDEGRP